MLPRGLRAGRIDRGRVGSEAIDADSPDATASA